MKNKKLGEEKQGNLKELRARIYCAIERQNHGEAEAALAELLKISPQEAMELSVALAIECGDVAAARAAMSKLEQAYKDAPATRYYRLRTEFLAGERVSLLAKLKKLSEDALLPEAYLEKVLNLLGQCARFAGDAETACNAYLKAGERAGSAALAALEYSNYLFNRHYLPAKSLTDERRSAEEYAKFFRDVQKFPHRVREMRGARRLRVGFLSPDFREHVVITFASAMFGISKEEFEVFGYSLSREDAFTERVRANADVWRNLSALSAKDAARVIYEDGIDILVELAGHTNGRTLPILAHRPAPIQMSGIGYFASTGLPDVDYFLSDIYLDDEEMQEAFTEELLLLPHSHFCYHPLKEVPPVSLPLEKNSYVTFGSFNNFSKVSDDVLKVWKEILDRAEGAHLLLKSQLLGMDDGRLLVEARLRAIGFDLSRVELRGETKDYLKEYADVDIALDTFPYPGGGTSCDALYMGVPLVTLAGDTHGSRFGVSLLENVGLGGLIARTREEYIERAVELSKDAALLKELRKKLRGMMKQSPLMDETLYQEDLASAFRAVYDLFVERRAPLSYPEAIRLKAVWEARREAGRDMEALALADTMMSAEPEGAFWQELAVYYLDMRDAQGARAIIARAAELHGYDRFLRASAYEVLGDRSRAEQEVSALLEERLPGEVEGAAHHLYANLLKARGARKEAAEEFLKSSNCKTLETGKLADYSNYLFHLQYGAIGAVQLLEAAKGYGKLVEEAVAAGEITPYEHKNVRVHKKLCVGYISPDFGKHVMAHFMQALFHADAVRFEVFGYALNPVGDLPESLKKATIFSMAGKTAEEVAAKIYADEIDILVDLSGHTGGNALPVLAYRPAPVQISGIGYFSTTGLSAVDYFLTDEHTALLGEERYFTEKLLRLPHSHWCYQPLEGAPEQTFRAPFQDKGYITFGSLNQLDKLTAKMMDAWAKILGRVEGARLFLKTGALDDAARREKILAEFSARGIARERILLEGHSADYFSAYANIDIALDTFPYVGGGTTCDALYAGVPVVTLAGNHHHGRFALSMLEEAGLADLLAADRYDTYVEKAAALAENGELLAELHRTLRRKLEKTAVMHEARYMVDLEEAYEKVYWAWAQSVSDEQKNFADKLKAAYTREDYEGMVRLSTALDAAGNSWPYAIYLAALGYNNIKNYEYTLYWAEKALAAGNREEEAQKLRYMQVLALERTGRLHEAMQKAQQEVKRMDLQQEIRVAQLAMIATIAFKLGHSDCVKFHAEEVRANQEARKSIPEIYTSYSSYLFVHNFIEIGEAELLRRHLGYNKIFQRVRPYTKYVRKQPHKKLRVGYISPDFRHHVMYQFAMPFLTKFDAEKFEVYVYSIAREPDEYTELLKLIVPNFRVGKDTEPDAVAQMVYQDEIDILFDLAGHTAYGGLPVLARRPAPIQISGIGYMATTGLSAVDYFFTDENLDPRGMHEKYFTEKFLYVKSHFSFVPTLAPKSMGTPARKNGYITFGVFNHYGKCNDAMLALWKEILERVPNARIVFKSQVFFAPEMQEAAYERFQAAGLPMDRVLLEKAVRHYLPRYLDIDLALDTYPYPGGGTTCDALYMGVPVLSRYGDRHSTRFAYSVLKTLGLEGLTVKTPEEYVERAVALAGDLELLDVLHKNLRHMMEQCVLLDSDAFMRDVEAQYQRIWKDYEEKE